MAQRALALLSLLLVAFSDVVIAGNGSRCEGNAAARPIKERSCHSGFRLDTERGRTTDGSTFSFGTPYLGSSQTGRQTDQA